jgi:hypothetical protein
MIENIDDISTLSDRQLAEMTLKCVIAHNRRLDALETWRTYMTGAFSVITVVFGIVCGFLLSRL